MLNVKYVKDPGFVSDLIFVFILHFNRECWSKVFVNLDKGNEDFDFYNDILKQFPSISDDLLIFFYFMFDRPTFMTHFYIDPFADKFEDEYSLNFLCEKFSDYESFKNNLILYYFGGFEETINKFNSMDMHQISLAIAELDLPDKVKQILIMFFLNPKYYVDELISSFNLFDKYMEKYYKENYNTVSDICGNMNKQFFDDILKSDSRNFNVDIEDLLFSICLIRKNYFQFIFVGDKNILIYGICGNEIVAYLSRQNEQIKLDKFGKIISEPNRVKILDLLAENEEIMTSEIARLLNISVTAAFYHLENMIDMKMLYSRNEGRAVFYRLNTKFFEKVSKQILEYKTKLEALIGDKTLHN